MDAIELTHMAIMTPLSDLQMVSSLAEQLNMSELSNLQYGTHIPILCFWMSQKMDLCSSDIVAVLQAGAGFAWTTRRIWNIANDSIVHSKNLATPVVYGGNIIMPRKERFTQEEVKTAISILNLAHPLQKYLAKIVKKHYSVNYLDISGLRELLKLIDFPIYSICALLKCLGHSYIAHNPYIKEGVAIGKVANPDTPLCCMYNRSKFKLMDFTTFAYLADQGMLKEPLTTQQTLMLGVITNHIKEDQ